MSEYNTAIPATIDQTIGAAHYLADQWGDYGYRLGYAGSDRWDCYHSDGSEFHFFVNRYGVQYEPGNGA